MEPDHNVTIFVDAFQSEKQFDALEVFDGKVFKSLSSFYLPAAYM